MRLLVTMNAPTAYGAGKVVADYCEALTAAGHSVWFAYDQQVSSTGTTPSTIVPRLEESGVTVLRLPGLTLCRRMVSRRRDLAALDLDLVIATQLRDAPAVAILARAIETPFAMLVQNPPRFTGSPAATRLKRWLHLAALRRTRLVVCVSEEIAAELVDAGVDGARVHAVLNAVDPGPEPGQGELGSCELRSRFGVGEDDVLALCVARVHPQKGIDILFDAATEASERLDRRLVVVIAGAARQSEAALERTLRQRAAKSEGALVMAGHQGDIRALLEASDFFVLPSLFEGGPSLAALEAMAAGVPPILSDHGARLEGFEDGTHGTYFPVGDVSALASRLVHYTNMMPNQRRAEGARARAYVVEHRSPAASRDRFVSLVESTVSRC